MRLNYLLCSIVECVSIRFALHYFDSISCNHKHHHQHRAHSKTCKHYKVGTPNSKHESFQLQSNTDSHLHNETKSDEKLVKPGNLGMQNDAYFLCKLQKYNSSCGECRHL